MGKKISVGQAARILGVSSVWVRSLIRRGKLTAEKTPLGFLLFATEVERLAQDREVLGRGRNDAKKK